jgi:hypothetical protein
MHILDEQQGFPRLPDSVLRLQRGKDNSPANSATAAAIENGFGRLG